MRNTLKHLLRGLTCLVPLMASACTVPLGTLWDEPAGSVATADQVGRTTGAFLTADRDETLAVIQDRTGDLFDPFEMDGVTYHRLTYTTHYDGESIEVSGAVVVPNHIKEARPIVVSFMGTMFLHSQAPSVRDRFYLQEIYAAAGYVMFVPDYIGYGASVDRGHPYVIYESTVNAGRDMIASGVKFLEQQGIPHKKEVMLTGYSEGGYASFAMQKSLEEKALDGITLVASAPGGGVYDLVPLMNGILSNDSYPAKSYIALVFKAYNDAYWQRPLTDLFQEPYASKIPGLLDGKTDFRKVTGALSVKFNRLMNREFLKGYLGDGEVALKQALARNSVHDWTPTTPTRLFHGERDPVVSFTMVEQSYNTMIANGASPDTVRLVKIKGRGHGDSIPSTMFQTLKFFGQFN